MKSAVKTDAEIQQAVLRELKWDPRVEESDVGVEVDNGVVMLTGTVSSYAKHLAAQEAAHRVRGVLDVADDIQVQAAGPHVRSDTELAQAVRRALEWDVLVPADRIQSTVTDGFVTLEGTVDLGHQREDADHAVRYLRGVRGVTNKLVVTGPSADEEDIRYEIEQALERRAEREAKRIQVTVKDGMATLTGPVQSWAERQAVVGAARFTPGVREVKDQLRIDWNN
jgi:osmotically-inducible protein OsmY